MSTQPNDHQLLTARDLVAELGRLGAGTWKPDAVRQWIREDAPCPIAQASRPGEPHRYDLAQVLGWLLDRARRTPKGAQSTEVARIEQASAALQAETDAAAVADLAALLPAVTEVVRLSIAASAEQLALAAARSSDAWTAAVQRALPERLGDQRAALARSLVRAVAAAPGAGAATPRLAPVSSTGGDESC